MNRTRLVKNLRTHRALLVEVLAEESVHLKIEAGNLARGLALKDSVHFAGWVRLEARMSVLLSWEV